MEYESEQTKRFQKEAEAELLHEVKVQMAATNYLAIRRKQQAELEEKRAKALAALRRIETDSEIPPRIKNAFHLLGQDMLFSKKSGRREEAAQALQGLKQVLDNYETRG